MYLMIYVDDMLIAAKDKTEVQKLKAQLGSEFEMKDLGPAKKMLGITITRDRAEGILILSQKDYIEKVLQVFNMENSKAVQTLLGTHFKLKSCQRPEDFDTSFAESVPYSNAVGSIMYAMIGTRPDLAYPVRVISRFMSKSERDHWEAVKWVLRYMRGTTRYGLKYQRTEELHVKGFCDADFASDPDRRRSITGFIFTVGGNVVCWKSGLQGVVALSTTEAEYMALTEAVKEGIWLSRLITELGFEQKSVKVFCDSQSAIDLTKNSVHHERAKHIDVSSEGFYVATGS